MYFGVSEAMRGRIAGSSGDPDICVDEILLHVSTGIRKRHAKLVSGKPCSRTTTGPPPASM
ncbi:hypothetical protein WL79_20830 [Burkholderia ubonensis]|nr:hypothetical protein WL79_20830 [Burkholderia ubonensis]